MPCPRAGSSGKNQLSSPLITAPIRKPKVKEEMAERGQEAPEPSSCSRSLRRMDARSLFIFYLQTLRQQQQPRRNRTVRRQLVRSHLRIGFPGPGTGCSKAPAPARARGRTASRPAPIPPRRPVRAPSRTALLAARRVPGQVPQPRAARSQAAAAVPHRDHRVRPRYGGNKFLRAEPPLRNALEAAAPARSRRNGAGRDRAGPQPHGRAPPPAPLAISTAHGGAAVPSSGTRPAPPGRAPRPAAHPRDLARPGSGFAGQRPEPRGAERSGAQRRARTRRGRAGPAAALREAASGTAAPLRPPTAAGRDARRGTAGPGGGAERRGAAFKGPPPPPS